MGLHRLFPLIADTGPRVRLDHRPLEVAAYTAAPGRDRSPECGPAVTADPRDDTETLVYRVGIVNASSSFELRDAPR